MIRNQICQKTEIWAMHNVECGLLLLRRLRAILKEKGHKSSLTQLF